MRWASIDDLVDACDEAGLWSESFENGALESAKKAYVRRLTKQLKDAQGIPVFESIDQIDPETGEKRRVYMQPDLFSVEDFRVVVAAHYERSEYHLRIAKIRADQCRQKYGVMVLPGFSEIAA